MAIHLHPTPEPHSAEILDFPNSRTEDMLALERQLENIQTHLALRHGEPAARVMLAEASLRIVARAAHASGHLISTRYALEVAADRAFGITDGGAA